MWVDYDNDGWLDLFVVNHDSARPNALYRNLGGGTFVRMPAAAISPVATDAVHSLGAAWGDYDNDGFPDVFVPFGTIFSPQRNGLYRNLGNTNSWTKIRCVGTLSNRSAIGAKVHVKAKIAGADRWQMRQIVSSEGWLTANSLDVLIGLGDATMVDTLRVEWPSGRVQEFHNLPTKQTLVVVERTELAIARASANAFDLAITGPRQQRYRLEASADLTDWSPVASLTITNQDGTATYTHTPAGSGPAKFFRATPE